MKSAFLLLGFGCCCFHAFVPTSLLARSSRFDSENRLVFLKSTRSDKDGTDLDGEFIDSDSLGDWKDFRRKLMLDFSGGIASKSNKGLEADSKSGSDDRLDSATSTWAHEIVEVSLLMIENGKDR